MSENNRELDMCPRCMTPLNGNKVCPRCRFEPETYTPAKHHLPPRTILDGKYLVGCVLGEGGFGITYVGWDLQLHTMVAIKEYFPTGIVFRDNTQSNVLTVYSGNGEKYFLHDRDKFLREAQMLAKFGGNPGVVDVKNYFKENGTAYIVMEYVRGINLDAYTEQNGGKLPLNRVLELLETPIKTLGEMHRDQTYHRDLSPENMMVTENGSVKLIDFGSTMTILKDKSTTTLKVREGYSPIELYTMTGQEGPFSDIYALSATIYRTVTGITPPAATDRVAQDTLVPPLKAGAKGMTQAQEQALMKGLAVRAQDRYQTVEDLYSGLINGKKAGKEKGKSKWILIAAACVAVLALGLWGLLGGNKAPAVAVTEESFHGDTALYEMYKQGDYRECTAAITPEGLRIVRYDVYTAQLGGRAPAEPQPISAETLKADLDALEATDYWPSMENLLFVDVEIPTLEPLNRAYKTGTLCIEFHNCVLPGDPSPLKATLPSLFEFGGYEGTVFPWTSLDFLKDAQKLNNLSMVFDPEKPVDLSVLDTLPGPEFLRFENAEITAEMLEKWVPHWEKVRVLSMINAGLTDISPLAALTGLEELTLAENAITDVSPLKALKNLTYLGLNSNRIQDVSMLEREGLVIEAKDQQTE